MFKHTNTGKQSHSQTNPCAFAYKVVCEDPQYTKPTCTYVGEDASYQFIRHRLQEQEHVQNNLKNIQPMILTEEDKKKFESSSFCCICEQPFSIYDKQY